MTAARLSRLVAVAVVVLAALGLWSGEARAQVQSCEGDQIHYEVYTGHPHHAGDVVHTISDEDHATGPLPPSAYVCVWPADAPQDDTSHGPGSTPAPDPSAAAEPADSSSGPSWSASSSSLASSSSDGDGSDGSTGSAGDPPTTGGLVADIVNGLVLLGLALVPSLPGRWRLGLVGFGLLLLVMGIADGAGGSTHNHTLTAWDLAIPIIAVAVVLWGHWANTATGATAWAPGRAPAGAADPAAVTAPMDLGGARSTTSTAAGMPTSATVYATPLTAGARSTVRLVSTTSLPIEQALDAVRRAAQVRGNFFLVWGESVSIEATAPDGFVCRSGSTAVFRVHADAASGPTRLRVGGFDRYRTSRQYVAGFIPVSPATVQGFRAYKVFLSALARELHRLDPGCRTVVGTPAQTPLPPLPPLPRPPRQPA